MAWLLVFLVWVFWASCSTGGLAQLREKNPEYPDPNVHVAYLLSQLHADPVDGFWLSSQHVEDCSLYMPDWQEAENCVRIRFYCEMVDRRAPYLKREPYQKRALRDSFSKEYRECFKEFGPTRGVYWYLHASRYGPRLAVGMMFLKLSGASQDDLDWDRRNKWWAEPIFRWMMDGQ